MPSKTRKKAIQTARLDISIPRRYSREIAPRLLPSRAKVLTPAQIRKLLKHAANGKNAIRDTALIHLSFSCGLRSVELSGLRWDRNVLDSAGRVGDAIHITRDATKAGERTHVLERSIPLTPETKAALRALRREVPEAQFVISPLTDRYVNGRAEWGRCDPNTIVQYLRRLYRDCGFTGATSHSGRRTFITRLAQNCNKVNASIRDVQALAGHSSLESTADYIDLSPQTHALVRLVTGAR